MFRANLMSRPDRLLVCPERKAEAGFWLSVEPFTVLATNSELETIGVAILSALGKSSGTELDPTDWKEFGRPRLAAAGVKTETAFQRGSKLVCIEMSAGKICFTPNHNGGTKGDSKGFRVIESEVSCVPASVTPSEIGRVALASLLKCTSEA